MKHLEEFMRRTWDFKRNTDTLAAGNYEWPFETIIQGCTPESLEGLSETWVVYRMKATIERGMLQQNSIARKQVRLVRTLDPAALELSHAMVCHVVTNHSIRIWDGFHQFLGFNLELRTCRLYRTHGSTK